jgi:hypothetical protein
MVVCTPTKRARIMCMREKEKMDFQEIGDKLGFSRSCTSRNYAQVKKTGDPYHYVAVRDDLENVTCDTRPD